MREEVPKLPFLTDSLPGVGGALRQQLDDFCVDEIPAYQPCGEGDHVFLWIEKRELTTAQVMRSIAKELGISDRDMGSAGLKDKRAVTRQMLSLPPPVTPEAALALNIPGLEILSATRHGNKLKTGHLQGNRFRLRLRQLDCSPAEAQERASAIFDALANAGGAPNWFGAQRFGRFGDNHEIGKSLVLGEAPKGPKRPKGKQRRLYISAYQSHLFNDYLAERIRTEKLSTVLTGDLLQKRESGGIFASDDPAADQARLDAGELAITGPMFGHKMKAPTEDTPSAALESALLRREGIEAQSFKHLGKLALGTRRALTIPVEGSEVLAVDDALEIRFTLPSGSYATAIMRELIKGDTNFPE